MRTAILTLYSLCVCAAEPGLERALQAQEAAQRGLAAQAEQAARNAEALAAGLRYNRLAEEDEAERVGQIATGISTLVDGSAADRSTMVYVQQRLAEARRGDAPAELSQAVDAQGAVLARISDMAANAKAGVEGTGGIDALRLAIDTQRRLSDEARGFADRIAITDVDHLGAVDRADLERLARRQLAMEGAVREVISSLAAQAGSASGQARDRFAQASRQLADGPALAEIGSADSALRGGRIAEAGEHQEQVLAALESIELAATGSNRRKIEDLERDLRALNAQLERQSRLREELTAKDQKQDQPATKRQQAEQREIAEALRKQAESQRRREDRQAKEASAKSGAARPKGSPPPGSERVAKAQQAAAKAAQQLAKDQRKEGEEAMREAMDALQQAQREMQQQVDQLRNEDLSRQPARTGTEPNRSGSKRGKMGSGLERGELAARKHRDWEVELEPQERETLAQGRGEAFPDRYDQALRQYYEALAGIGAEP